MNSVLFSPFTLRSLHLANRIVMAPMTRSFSPGGVPGADVAAYYRRRAEGGIGLIVTEGTYVPHAAAGFDPRVPRLYGAEALAAWRRVVDEVHAAGGKIFAQLWHVGMVYGPLRNEPPVGVEPVGPSGLKKPGELTGRPMSQAEIDAVVKAFGAAASNARQCGFDGVEIHGAHGYLIDQFSWEGTNRRTDAYGGSVAARMRFATEIVGEIRRQVGPDFPVAFRFSQWKLQDYTARLASTPEELEVFLDPLARAAVDLFHCSTRRYWEPEFPGSALNLAGWTKKLTGKPTVTVGSVTLDHDFTKSFATDETALVTGIDDLLERLERGEFDLVAIGRSLIVNPAWPAQVKSGGLSQLRPFHRTALTQLI
ncbi:MAG TPA: NADH:flavin oxidoreductase [Bryobacteraceae bacterium]|nr:NADH:flavin oxidoreductase [Bryobacteraceae bacterium]